MTLQIFPITKIGQIDVTELHLINGTLKYITRVRCKQRKRYCAGQSLQKIMNDNNEQPAEIVLSVLQDETSH